MPVPAEYQRARDQFYEFLEDARDTAGLTSTHQAYTMVEGVFRVFRRRLTLRDAIRFAQVLPAGARALFVADWDADEPRRLFESRDQMTKEVQNLRPQHNFAPDTAIRDVAEALRRNLDESALEKVLADLPEGAREFWRKESGPE